MVFSSSEDALLYLLPNERLPFQNGFLQKSADYPSGKLPGQSFCGTAQWHYNYGNELLPLQLLKQFYSRA